VIRVATSRPKLLFIGSLDVAPTFGGPIQFYRHFVQRNDFEFHKLVEKPQPRLANLQTGQPWLDRAVDRASRTRFFPHFAAYNEWRGVGKAVPGLVEEAIRVRPDAIVTVAFGAYGFAAERVAARLRLPLITFFHDWWPDITLESRPGIAAFDRRMRRLYRRSDLAFCVCDEMKQELGGHPNAKVLYPISSSPNGYAARATIRERSRVVYLGGMTKGYGRLLYALSQAYAGGPARPWELAVFGETRDWPAEAVAQATASRVYRGTRYGDDALQELADADVFLVVMDFEQESRRRVRTSFPSKLLEYCAYRKPIVIWAPEFSSVARFAAQTDFALLHTADDPASFMQRLNSLTRDKALMDGLSRKAACLAETVFSPDAIHRSLVREIEQLLARHK
jgi:glycosyltransferase involved in cell wall biosynthesis